MHAVVTKQMEKFAASQHLFLCVGFLWFALCLLKFTYVWLMANLDWFYLQHFGEIR